MKWVIVLGVLGLSACQDEYEWAVGGGNTTEFSWPEGQMRLEIDAVMRQEPSAWPRVPVSNALRISTRPPVDIAYPDRPDLEVNPHREGVANLRGILEACDGDRMCVTRVRVVLSSSAPPTTVDIDADVIVTGRASPLGRRTGEIELALSPAE
jgi:hypothetical protein